jgi:hypothetical protein
MSSRMTQITNDKGETLDLASSLTTYLANIFHTGDWLKRLTVEELAKIQRLSEASKAGDTAGNKYHSFGSRRGRNIPRRCISQ